MGLLDEVGKVLDTVESATPIDLVTGIKGAVTDVPNLVGDVAQGNFGQAFVDGRKVLGDGKDIAMGLSSLGANLGPVPSFLENNTATKLTESKVLAAAQLLIEGMKKTTGSGAPCTGEEFQDSSKRLADVVETLIHAEVHEDRWDGTASQVYNATNASHRRLASDVQAADAEIAGHLDTEAGQVTRTRNTLDESSDNLTKYDLATMWMNATPPTRALKFALDCTAAAGALDVSGVTMGVLVKNSLENAARIKKAAMLYGDAAKDTSGNPLDPCGAGEVFSVPDPQHQLPRPNDATPLPPLGEDNQPKRSLPDMPYTVPDPEEPTVQAPATPYGAPPPAAPR
ncbi:EspA/EspE family type VII secretion system effector [Mycolicibacterium sp. P9-64]|uniref:EspA/EspE family type VII secretion system effector n=1 Tax=Mycolicibacterium sp. P9-64 TaxID=2024612 RepID=UPI0011EE2E84|nr:EspA/EspE family type VII secretion system effector [Mycolicibacterium sp. P9-64]